MNTLIMHHQPMCNLMHRCVMVFSLEVLPLHLSVHVGTQTDQELTGARLELCWTDNAKTSV